MTTTTSRPAPRRAPAATPSPSAGRAGRAVALVAVGVRDRLPLAVVMALLLVGMGVLTGGLWPPLQDTFADLPSDFDDILASLVGGSASIATPEGWVNAEMLSLVAPAAVIAAGVLSAVRGVAGEEEDQTLGILLSAPVSRSAFVLAKAAATAVHLLVAVAGLAVGLVAGDLLGDLGLSASGIAGACLHALGLGLLFAGVALLAAALTGQRRLSAVVAAGLAALSFVVFLLAPLVDALAGLEKASPWYWFTGPEPLVGGADAGYLALLAVPAVLLVALAVMAHRRRDLRG